MIVIFVEFIDQLIDYPINRANPTFLILVLVSFVCSTMGEEAAVGPILSDTGLSGSDRDVNVSDLLWRPKDAVVSNREVEKLGVPHFIHSHAIFLLNDLLKKKTKNYTWL